MVANLLTNNFYLLLDQSIFVQFGTAIALVLIAFLLA